MNIKNIFLTRREQEAINYKPLVFLNDISSQDTSMLRIVK